MPRHRVLLTGWFSFEHGEATAGDLLAAEAVAAALRRAGRAYDVAWSPVLAGAAAAGGPLAAGALSRGAPSAGPPAQLELGRADPARYTHLVFACGPLHSRPPAPLLGLHRRFAAARRIAVGVSVLDPDDPAVRGFHRVLLRDAPDRPPRPDLSTAAPRPPADHPGPPVVGVILTHGQHEYGARRRHAEAAAVLDAWLGSLDAAPVVLDTRVDPRDWRLPSAPDRLHAVLRRLDAVVTDRLHGLVLALRAGVPALAVDPVAGGAKVSAQAAALDWPAVLPGESLSAAGLDRWWSWCLGPGARALARRHAAAPSGDADPELLRALLAELRH